MDRVVTAAEKFAILGFSVHEGSVSTVVQMIRLDDKMRDDPIGLRRILVCPQMRQCGVNVPCAAPSTRKRILVWHLEGLQHPVTAPGLRVRRGRDVGLRTHHVNIYSNSKQQ